MNQKNEYLLSPRVSSVREDMVSRLQSKTTSPRLPEVTFDTDFSPSLSYADGFFMAISYKVDGVEQHQRIPLDVIQVTNLISQGAKSVQAHVKYDLKE
jgi:hypothetical protein